MTFLSTCKRPVLLAGMGARSAGAVEALHRLQDKCHVPILTTMNAVDIAQGDRHIGFIGTYGNRAANMIMDECDLVVSVGARLGLRQVGNRPCHFAPKARLVRVDIDQYELARDVKPAEQKLLMDAGSFVDGMLANESADFSEWMARCVEVRDLLDRIDDTEGNECMRRIAEVLPANPVVAVDIGQVVCWCAQSLVLRGDASRMLVGGSYGTMGCGLPYAIGASIATGGGPVFCVTGDGGLQMNIQELETVRREGLPIKIIVVDNRALGKISEIQRGTYGGRYAQTTASSGYTVPDFAAVASAYGIRSASLSSADYLADYRDWMLDGLPCLVDVRIPEDSSLIPKIMWGTGKMEPSLDPLLHDRVVDILRG